MRRAFSQSYGGKRLESYSEGRRSWGYKILSRAGSCVNSCSLSRESKI
jgi:hypothetical protein